MIDVFLLFYSICSMYKSSDEPLKQRSEVKRPLGTKSLANWSLLVLCQEPRTFAFEFHVMGTQAFKPCRRIQKAWRNVSMKSMSRKTTTTTRAMLEIAKQGEIFLFWISLWFQTTVRYGRCKASRNTYSLRTLKFSSIYPSLLTLSGQYTLEPRILPLHRDVSCDWLYSSR